MGLRPPCQEDSLSSTQPDGAKSTPGRRQQVGTAVEPTTLAGMVGGIVERKPAAPRPMNVPQTKGARTSPGEGGKQDDEEGVGEWAELSPPPGSMKLAAPMVVSDVVERGVEDTASGGALAKSKSRFGRGRGGLRTRIATGGFPVVGHRSEMRLMRPSQGAAAGSSSSSHGSSPTPSSKAGGEPLQSGTGPSVSPHPSPPTTVGSIHAENLSRLAAMSPLEVQEARQEIFSTLSKAAIEMLRNRGQAKATAGVGGRSRDQDQRGKGSCELGLEKRDGHGKVLGGRGGVGSARSGALASTSGGTSGETSGDPDKLQSQQRQPGPSEQEDGGGGDGNEGRGNGTAGCVN
ncbi:unnamed protein product, partial [Discosporangium mesarthrocarpum]